MKTETQNAPVTFQLPGAPDTFLERVGGCPQGFDKRFVQDPKTKKWSIALDPTNGDDRGTHKRWDAAGIFQPGEHPAADMVGFRAGHVKPEAEELSKAIREGFAIDDGADDARNCTAGKVLREHRGSDQSELDHSRVSFPNEMGSEGQCERWRQLSAVIIDFPSRAVRVPVELKKEKITGAQLSREFVFKVYGVNTARKMLTLFRHGIEPVVGKVRFLDWIASGEEGLTWHYEFRPHPDEDNVLLLDLANKSGAQTDIRFNFRSRESQGSFEMLCPICGQAEPWALVWCSADRRWNGQSCCLGKAVPDVDPFYLLSKVRFDVPPRKRCLFAWRVLGSQL